MKKDEICVFCKIINKEIPCKLIAESDDTLVIEDIAPKAPIHYLIMPKKHIDSIQSVEKSDSQLLGDIFLMAKRVSKRLENCKNFNLVMNNGFDAGQRVFHMHMHFLVGLENISKIL